MAISNKKFRFGTIAGIRSGITNFPFPCFNHLKYFPGLPESIEKLNIKTKEMRKNG
jgi:hypothetical protein